MQRAFHTIEPVYDERSKILILGTFPSPKSREEGFYYAHPQNRFWKVLAHILDIPLPKTKDEKVEALLSHHIALWDVVESCEISGASDNSIKNALPNDFERINTIANIRAVFTTGYKATEIYSKLLHREPTYLPSTSPANCAVSFDILCEKYSEILEYLK